MFNYEQIDYSDMPLDQLGDIRDFALLKLERVSEALRARVREEHATGIEVSVLAKKARVSRNTIHKWLK